MALLLVPQKARLRALPSARLMAQRMVQQQEPSPSRVEEPSLEG